MPLLTVSRGKVSQSRVTEELAKYKSTSGKRKEAGKKGGAASGGKDSGNGQAIAEQLPTQSESKSESKVEEEANASSVVGTTAKGRKARKQTDYPLEFEEVWLAYPHTQGRSSKPNSLDEWRLLPADQREGLPSAVAAFRPNVAKACGDRGAPCMSRWLKDGKHLNWTAITASSASAPGPTFSGPAELRARILALTDPEFVAGYIDPAGWDAGDRALIARTKFGADEIRRRLRAYLAEKQINVTVVGQPARRPEGVVA
jgi:hypothetical protein